MISNIQILRGFAASNVVFFHIIGTASVYGPPVQIFEFLTGWGSNGVDIFFVISGFVMLYSQLQNRRSTGVFLKSRIIRIVPIYWFVTFLTLVSFLLVPASAFNSDPPSISHILESLFFLSGAISHKAPIVHVGWTLEWEMLFYIIFGFALLFSNWLIGMLFVFVVLSIVSVSTGNLFIMEFFMGMLIAYCYHKYTLRSDLALLLLVIGIFLLFMNVFDHSFDNLDRIIVTGIPASIIVLGCLYTVQWDNRVFKFFGDASYSIYLIQNLSIPAFYKAASKIVPNFNGDFLALLCLGLSVIAGGLMYLFIEKPTTNFLRKKSANK